MMSRYGLLAGATLALFLGLTGAARAFVFNTPAEHVFEHPFGSLFDTRLLGIDADRSVAFNKALASGYSELSDEDANKWITSNNWDFPDGELFKHKARTAGRNSLVLPEHPDDRELADEDRAMFRDVYDRLHRAFDHGARFEAPAVAAIAQVSYDCWISAVEDGDQEQADTCKAAFEDAMAAAEAAATYALTEFKPYGPPAATVVAAVEHPRSFLVYFDFDQSEIRQEGRRVIDEALAAAGDLTDTAVRVVAHTDTAGPVDYNQALSERRANAVVGALVEGGLDRSRIISEAVGQTRPLVDTGDGVREQANRVAEIDLL